MQDQVLVTDGSTEVAADVIETYTHRGIDVAKVQVRGQTAFVEMPDNPKQPTVTVACTECGHDEMVDGETKRVDEKAHECTHEGNAELLARIHAIKTGHSPTVA